MRSSRSCHFPICDRWWGIRGTGSGSHLTRHQSQPGSCSQNVSLSAFLETCKCVPVLSPDWRQHRSKSQVDAFTCFGRILNLLEELLLPDRIVECRNGLCSTGQISAQRHIQVAEFRYACL